jgi:GNAT superfamily N-acetyltransferase
MNKTQMQTANLQVVPVTSAEQYGRLRAHADLPQFDTQRLTSHRPDDHWMVTREDLLTARCSLWWRNTPTVQGQRVGLIGHYAAADDDSAAELLEFVSRQLASSGCTMALGPMDQNTWRDYRCITSDSGQPRFFMEPTHSLPCSRQFAQDGFQVIAWYFSALVEDLTIESARLDRVRNRMTELGVQIRPLRKQQLESDLKQIYAVSRVAFRNHLFYDPISEADFLRQYLPLEELILPDMVLLAEHAGHVIGFCFAMPDLLQSERGAPIDTVIIKTFAALPERQYAGLGQILLEQTQQRAALLGFRHGIHALVAEGGHVQKISQRYAVPFRRYALFGKELPR